MTLDELHEKYHNTEIRFGDHDQRARVVGVTRSLPLEVGAEDEPALVVFMEGRVGHVYPHEVNRAWRDEYGGRVVIEA